MNVRTWILIGIFCAAAFFRFHSLASLPPGLYQDEALDGSQALHFHLRPFYSESPQAQGREGMFIWLEAVPVRLFGPSAWALRATSAAVGIVTVVGLYMLAQTVFEWQLAAIASFLLATSFWHVLFSRIAFRGILAPCVLVWLLYFLFRKNYILAGVLWGLGFYTYTSFQVTPLLLLNAQRWNAVPWNVLHPSARWRGAASN